MTTGILKYRGEFRDGEMTGQGESFYGSGAPEHRGALKNGIPHGRCVSFYSNGSVMGIGDFEDVYLKHGTQYGDNGKADHRSFGRFRQYFHANGQPAYTGHSDIDLADEFV